MIRRRDPKFDIRPTPNGNSYISVNQRRLTKDDIQWQHRASHGEEGYNPVYSSVDRSSMDKPPPIPPQMLDEVELKSLNLATINNVFDGNEANEVSKDEETGLSAPNLATTNDVYTDDEHVYAQPDLKPPRRRLTNSTKPKLAKLTSVEKKSYTLDTNPIYESTSSSLNKTGLTNGHAILDSDPVYAEPSLGKFTPPSTSGSSEPVYSEALNPSSFSPAPANRDSALLPYGPVYAEPFPLKKTEAPLTVTSENIREQTILGNGQFGEVILANTIGLSLKDMKVSATDDNEGANVLVAVKKLKTQADSTVKDSFEKEIQFMARLRDENIVRLIAVCYNEPKFLVLEYMENGDMFQFLNQHDIATPEPNLGMKQLEVSTLVHMAVQIASGMKYLASLHYVHRDLASRNCLIGKNFMVKISDFGMSRSLYESVYYRVRGKAMLPIRWMAKESFYGRFSEKTDVWSFGVTMWEIFSLCRYQPYEEQDDQELIQDAVRNKTRKLLDKPEFCADDIYRVMLRCWEYRMEDRANFKEIFNSLSHIYKQI